MPVSSPSVSGHSVAIRISGLAIAILATLMGLHTLSMAQTAPAAPAAPAPAQPAQPAPQPQFQPNGEWAKLGRMQIERQFAGPLQDTIIQRLRDTDGTICYLYLPISVQHSPVNTNGFVQYGPNGIGSISCMPAPAAPRRAGP